MTELQGKLLDLLKIFDEFCRKFDIQYYLTGGSLIGAVRHRGFIPWDDDADLIMTRDNFEKLYANMEGNFPEGIEMRSQYEDPTLSATVNHFTDVRTTEIYRFHLTKPEVTGILIDVLIMDPVPDDEEAKRDYRKALTEHTELTNLYYQYSLRTGTPSKFKEYYAQAKTQGLAKVLDSITAKAFHYTEEESQLYAQRFASAPHFWPKEYYGTPQYVPFEDTYLPIPERYGDCLSVGYDEDWFHIPRGGPTKTTHEYCVRSYTVPCEKILSDFEEHINRPEMMDLYLKRKNIWMEETDNKFHSEIQLDEYAQAAVQLQYEKKLADVDLRSMIEKPDYEALQDFFGDYLAIQCNAMVTGSSSIAGWQNWYRKCNPQLIDIGDEAIYAVLLLLVHKQRLGWLGRILRARERVDRPWPDNLQKMQKLYKDIREVVSLYERRDYVECRKVLTPLLKEAPQNPWFYKYDLKLKLEEGMELVSLEKEIDAGIDLFNRDDELLFLKSEIALLRGNRNEAVELYWELVKKTDNGLVMLAMKDRVEEILKEDKSDKIAELYLEVRRQSGEEMAEEGEPSETDESDEEDMSEGAESVEEEIEKEETSKDSLKEQKSENEGKESKKQDVQLEDLALFAGAFKRERELSPKQTVQLKLLEELIQICEENSITYFLGGRTLLDAIRVGYSTDVNSEMTVMMRSADVQKFLKAVEEKKDPRRRIDSMGTTPNFHRFCLRYCDMETVDFSATQMAEPSGIFVTVEILRRESKNKLINKYYQMLELGWEAQNITKKTTKNAMISEKLVGFLCKIQGRDRFGKRLFRKLLEDPKKPVKDQVFQRYYFGNRLRYPSFWFEHNMQVSYEGLTINTLHFYEEYLKRRFGRYWMTRELEDSKWNPIRRVINTEISASEFTRFLKEEKGIDQKAVWKVWRETNRKYAQIKDLNKKADEYWALMEASAYRYEFAQELFPKKKALLKLYKSGHDQELFEELDDYIQVVLKLAKKGIGLYIDKDLQKIAEYILFKTNYQKDAKKFKEYVGNQKWKAVKLN